jgi:hypothetical protein
MVVKRACKARRQDGTPCRATPLAESEYCLFHDPAHANEVSEARRLGGIRRRREVLTRGAYELEGLHTVDDIRRLLDIATLDTLGLENSIARNRTLIAATMAALKLLEVGELEERLRSLEAAVHQQRPTEHSAFDEEPFEAEFTMLGEGS